MLRRLLSQLFARKESQRRKEPGWESAVEFHPHVERLEDRAMLAAAPVAMPDPWYVTPLNTDLVVSSTSGAKLLANDYEVNFNSLTAAIVDQPAHGTIVSSGTDGTFTYRPDNGFSGLDSFTYTANNGSQDSNVATASIAVGGTFGPRTNLDENPLAAPLLSGENFLVRPLSLGESLVYNSNTSDPHPIVVVETTLQAASAVPDSIDAALTFGGLTGSTVSYTNTDLAAGDSLRFALQADASTLATGYVDWSLTLTANFSGSASTTRTYTGSQAVVNRTLSEFGNGWWLAGLDRLVPSTAGALLVQGNGSTLWFAAKGTSFDPAPGDVSFSTLVKHTNNTFTLTTKYGLAYNFGATGLLTSIVDTNGNTRGFTYTDADSDSVADEVSAITDPYSRAHAFSYTSGQMTTFTDYASHATTLAYASGNLASVTLSDPDGSGGSLAAPVWEYAYHATTNLLVTQEDPLNHDLNFEYGSASRRLTQVTYPFGSVYTLHTASGTVGLASGTGNALVETVNPQGAFTNQNGHLFKYRTDRFGGLTDIGYYAGTVSDDVTDTLRDPNGLALRILQPELGELGRPETRLGYSAAGDLVRQINPDATTLNWTYTSTLHRLLTAEDELARQTVYTYSTSGNELTRTDPGNNVWTTSYSGRTDGLPTSFTTPDPDGAGAISAYVTGFSYDSYGRLTTTTNPDDTTLVLAYNASNQVTTATNELGFTTTSTFDALARLTGITLADPDGSGSQTAPTTQFFYDAASYKTSETNALNQTTNFEYDAGGRLLATLLPDPDSGGPLGRAEISQQYDGVGNVIWVSQPTENYDHSKTYDPYGRLKSDYWLVANQATKAEYFTYNALGNLVEYTNSLSQKDFFEYNLRGWLVKQIGHDPDGLSAGEPGPTTVLGYNGVGQVISELDPLGNETRYVYTTAGLLQNIFLPDPDQDGPAYSPSYTFGHDALGREIIQVDPHNGISTTAYDWRGNVVSQTGIDPDGAGSALPPTVEYAFNDAGWLVSVVDSLNRETTYQYDNLQRVISWTLPDPDGAGSQAASTFSQTLNALGNVLTSTDALGNVTSTTYNNLQQKLTQTTPDPDAPSSGQSAATWQWIYDGYTRLAGVHDPLGHELTYTYDGYGRLASETSELGFTTTYAYNQLDQITQITAPDPDGASGSQTAAVTYFGYDFLNRRDQITDPNNGQTRFTFDVGGNLLSLEDPSSNTTAWAYNGLSQVTMETNELSATRSFWYDALGNQTRLQDRNGRVTQFVFDVYSQPLEENWLADGDPVPELSIATTTHGGPVDEVQRVGLSGPTSGTLGGTFTLSFGGQTTSAIAWNATAATVKTALEALSTIGVGEVLVVKTQNTSTVQEWKLTFQGALGGSNQNQTAINLGNVTYTGDPPSEIEATDVQGTTVTNDEVQVITLDNATAGEFRLAFLGQTTAPLYYNAAASSVESALDALQAIDNVSVSGSAGGPWTITFGGAQADINVAQLQGDASTSQSGSVTNSLAFTYDAGGQLLAAADADAAYTIAYDNLGRETSITAELAGLSSSIVMAQTFDANSFRTRLATTIGGEDDFVNDYLLDNLSRMTRIERHGVTGGNSVAETRIDLAYNKVDQFTSINRYADLGATDLVVSSNYGYDGNARLISLDHVQGSTALAGYDFSFDNMGRITSVDSLLDGLATYTYDATSQLTAANFAGQADETHAWDANGNPDGTNFEIGPNNQLLSDGTFTYEYDAEGNLILQTNIATSETVAYAWDHRDRLTDVVNRDDEENVVQAVHYAYDVWNRWVYREIDPDGAGSVGASSIWYAYDGNQLVLSFDDAEATVPDHRYLDGPEIDQYLAAEDSSGEVLYPLGDHRNSYRDVALLDLLTGDTEIVNHIVFDAFDQRLSETNAAIDFIFGETGRPFDEDTGLNNHLHRWLAAWMKRFLGEDPSGFSAGDPNLQRFVGNSTLNATDPSGLISPAPGHHYVNQANWTGMSAEVRQVFNTLSDATIWNNYYTSHNYGTANGISHAQYNQAVHSELAALLNGRDPSEMTPDEATKFLNDIKTSENNVISTFNDGVKKEAAEALKEGNKAFKAGAKAGDSPEKALKDAHKAAKEAVEKTRKGLNEAAEKAAKTMAAKTADAATDVARSGARKGASKAGVKTTVAKAGLGAALKGVFVFVGGLFTFGTTYAETGDLDASARDGFIDSTPLGIPVAAGKAGAAVMDHAEEWQKKSAEHYYTEERFNFSGK